MNHLRNRPWHLWLIALFVLFLYTMGIYDIFMMLSHDGAYYASHGYGSAVVAYFTDYPPVALFFWAGNLVLGALAPILLLANCRLAAWSALGSAVSDLLLLILTFTTRDRIGVLGVGIAVFDICIMLMTFAFYLYCRRAWRAPEKKG